MNPKTGLDVLKRKHIPAWNGAPVVQAVISHLTDSVIKSLVAEPKVYTASRPTISQPMERTIDSYVT